MQEIKIFVLCAGEGKRLRPYTEHQPKCLVPYLGKPLLQYQLEVFKQFNLQNITLIGGYRNDALPRQYPVVVNRKFATTNMLYSLFCAEEHMTDDSDIIVSYGDIIYHASVLEKLLQSNEPCGVVTDVDWQRYWQERMEDPLKDAETFRWDIQTHRIFELGIYSTLSNRIFPFLAFRFIIIGRNLIRLRIWKLNWRGFQNAYKRISPFEIFFLRPTMSL